MKKQSRLAKNSLKNFQFDWNRVIKREDPRPTELRAVIYCRVSGDKQVKEWFWLEGQEKLWKERCAKHKPPIEVVKVFREEGESGNLKIRTAFEKCVEFIKEQNSKYIKITHFVCRELSRISRPDLDDIGSAFEMENRIKQYWVEIVDITWWTKDGTDEEKLMKTFMYAFAGYDRKRIEKICQNGKRWRLLDGYRPFSFVPMGYKRTVLDKKWYIDEIDWDIANILKQWLELFANDPNMWQMQLYDYLLKKGLKSPTGGKVWKSYIEKMLQLHRLYFYAGYCIYPNWEINELIEGRHEWFISLETAEKIRKKITGWTKPSKWLKEDDDFMLKQLITCKGCWRKLTGWTTVKKKTGVWYSYYGCQMEWCPERDHIPKQKIEQQVIDMIQSIQFPDELMKLFDETLLNVWKGKEKDWGKEVKAKENRIRFLQSEKKRIEQYLLSGKGSVALQTKMDENWAEFDVEEKMLWEQLNDEGLIKIDKNKRLKKIRELIKSPLVFREQGDKSLRKQLIEVRFWDCLSYSKSQWLQTSDSPVLYNVLYDLKHNYSLYYPEGDLNPHVLTDTRFWV
jgi:site-specific DNA recombinase